MERARYYEWCFFVMTELDAHTLYVIRKHRDLADLYGDAPAAIRAAEQGFAKQVRAVELALRDGRPFLTGGCFTGADILLASCLSWAKHYKQPLAAPLLDYLERTTERDAYGRSFALNFSATVRT